MASNEKDKLELEAKAAEAEVGTQADLDEVMKSMTGSPTPGSGRAPPSWW